MLFLLTVEDNVVPGLLYESYSLVFWNCKEMCIHVLHCVFLLLRWEAIFCMCREVQCDYGAQMLVGTTDACFPVGAPMHDAVMFAAATGAGCCCSLLLPIMML